MNPPASPWTRWVPPALLVVLAVLPALSLIGHPGAFLAGPHSEVWVKLWTFEALSGAKLLGGDVTSVGFPNTGLMNNPDPLGTLLFSLFRPLFGQAGAYNTVVIAKIMAAMLAAWLLARDLTRDPWAALVAGVGFGLTPLVLVYPVLCGVTDILELWPYPLALLFALRALRRPGWRDGLLGGVFAGLGFVTCPYNFVVFSSIAFPLLIWLPLAWRQGLVPVEHPADRPNLRQWPRALGGMLLGVVLAGGWYALWMKLLMAGPGAQISEELVAGTRHVPPFRMLHPEELKRYTAFGVEYFAIGDGGLVMRDMISRFYRAFSPGYVLMAAALMGVLLSRGRRFAVSLWLVIALFAALASTGPFMPWSRFMCLDRPLNPAWLSVHYLLPGGKLILEPLRFAFVVALALSMAASLGVAALARRWGTWVGLVAPLLVVAELILISPVPVPLPVADLEVSPAYDRLDELLPPGPIIELPYFDGGTQRFDRRHFVQQLRHGRPIADEVVGFPPRYLVENQFTAELLGVEKPFGAVIVRVEWPERIPEDRERLARDGFVGIVVDPSNYDSPARAEQVLALLATLGEPVQLEDRLVFTLTPGPSTAVVPDPIGE